MREIDRLDRQCDVTVLWGVDEELAVVSVTASGKLDFPRAGKKARREESLPSGGKVHGSSGQHRRVRPHGSFREDG